MTSLWPAPTSAQSTVIQGRTARFACKTMASVEVHLDQMRRTMFTRAAHPDTTVLADFAALLSDRDRLLEHRHQGGCKYCGPDAEPLQPA